LPFVL